ncbi:MAG: hypothetical protein ACI4QY_06635 [Oscillospiraceae bacterium]
MAFGSCETDMKNVLFWLCQATWGIFQTLVGAVLFLGNLAVSPKSRRYLFHGAVVTEWGYGGSVSLGMFVFVSGRGLNSSVELLAHEYGHCIQSLILGALYLPVIGLPSVIWAGLFRKYRRKTGAEYDSFYPERWATFLGNKFINGEKQ